MILRALEAARFKEVELAGSNRKPTLDCNGFAYECDQNLNLNANLNVDLDAILNVDLNADLNASQTEVQIQVLSEVQIQVLSELLMLVPDTDRIVDRNSCDRGCRLNGHRQRRSKQLQTKASEEQLFWK